MRGVGLPRFIVLSASLLFAAFAPMRTSANADCDNVLLFNQREAHEQIAIFAEPDAQLKKQLLEDDAQRVFNAIKADSNGDDFRPKSSCQNDANMYYYLANVLSGLNSHAAFSLRAVDLPIAPLEQYVGHGELSVDLFKQIIRAEMNIHAANNNAVSPATQALANRYLPGEYPPQSPPRR
jgi:alanine-alpha-ketoisovalerate/valine-pyruvate aminotransferase